MNPRFARLLTRLYSPAWRARFGAEFQTFLESRDVSALEALDIARRALIERASEGWRAAILGMAFVGIPLFAGCCALYLGAGRPLAPAGLGIIWGATEVAAMALCGLLESPWAAVRGALGSGRLIGHAAFTVLASAVLLCFPSHAHMAAGLAG